MANKNVIYKIKYRKPAFKDVTFYSFLNLFSTILFGFSKKNII
jgi:hypothetical protein